MKRIAWFAPEYEEKERSKDWFWALGIIVATSSIAALIYENYFFALLLVLSGLLLGFFAVKKPEMVHYELNNRGLKIGSRLYPYENMKAFWVQARGLLEPGVEMEGMHFKPILFVKSERVFMPILSIAIEEEMASDIHTAFREKGIPEEEMREHISDKIMEGLGF